MLVSLKFYFLLSCVLLVWIAWHWRKVWDALLTPRLLISHAVSMFALCSQFAICYCVVLISLLVKIGLLVLTNKHISRFIFISLLSFLCFIFIINLTLVFALLSLYKNYSAIADRYSNNYFWSQFNVIDSARINCAKPSHAFFISIFLIVLFICKLGWQFIKLNIQ